LDLVQRYKHDKWKKTDNSYDKYAKDEFTFYLNLNNGFVSTKNIQIKNKESFEILFFKK